MKPIISLLKKSQHLLVELIIVFLGVYLAFQLNTYHESIKTEKIRNNYYQLIQQEFQANLNEIKYFNKLISAYRDSLENSFGMSEKVVIAPLKLIDLENNMLVLKSAFQNGHLENLNPKYVSNLSIGSNVISRIVKMLDRYNNSIYASLAANNWDNNLFFTPKGTLKPKYHWIVDDLLLIENYLTKLANAMEFGAIPDTKKLIGDH